MRREVNRKLTAVLALLAAQLYAPLDLAAALPQMPETLESLVLPDKPPDAQWVWLGDFQNGLYARSILYDGRTGATLGSLDIGWEGIKLDFPRSGKVIYNHAMYMSRGYRGERTDTITAYDRNTLKPLREIVVPPKAIRGYPDPNHTALSDDDRFMWIQFFTPASSIGVADLTANRYVGELETSGCAHVMAAGPRQVFTLCGDGSALAVTVSDEGREVKRKRYARLFDADADPLHGSGMRSGNTWYFVSYRGQVHEIEVRDGELHPGAVWPVSEKDGAMTWVPGPHFQPLAINARKKRLYVLMHASDLAPKGGGYDFHRAEASEVWVFDLDSKKRLSRIVLEHAGTALAVSQGPAPLLYVSSLYDFLVTAYDESSGRATLEIPMPTYPTLIQPVN